MPFLNYMVGGRRCFTAYQRGKPQLDRSEGADENAEGARLPRRYVVETTSPGTYVLKKRHQHTATSPRENPNSRDLILTSRNLPPTVLRIAESIDCLLTIPVAVTAAPSITMVATCF